MRKLRVKIKQAKMFIRNQIKNKSLSKVVAQRSNWSFKHIYQYYLKNTGCVQNTATYTTFLMFHAMTQKVNRLTETCLMALVVPHFSGNKSFTGFMLIELGKPLRFYQLYWLSSSPTIVNI